MVTVLHVGPDPRTQGGIASVISDLLAMSDDDTRFRAFATWRPDWSAWRCLAATVVLVCKVLLPGRHVDVVHVHLSESGSFVRKGLVVAACHVRGVPVVATLHGAEFDEFLRRRAWLVRSVLRRCDRVLCLGPQRLDWLQRWDPRLRLGMTFNPVKLDECRDSSTEVAVPRDVVLFAGELGVRKGFDRLAAAWPVVLARCPEARLVACGPVADDFVVPPLARFEHLGVVPRQDMPSLYRRSAIGCLPSRREVLPMFLLELLACGRTAVAAAAGEYGSFADCSAIRWIPQEKVTADSPAAEIVDLLESRPERADLEKDAVTWSRRHSEWSVVLQHLNQTYSEVLAERRPWYTRFTHRRG